MTAQQVTYAEVGATAPDGTLPAGYRHVRRQVVLGHGADTFAAASHALLMWEVHRGAGLTVDASSPMATDGAVVVCTLGIGRFGIAVPCQVVYVIDEEWSRGFGYGTLPGHPETGEEAFVIRHLPDDLVTLTIVAFSRPARWFTKLGGPVGRGIQDWVTGRYVRAMREIVNLDAPDA